MSLQTEIAGRVTTTLQNTKYLSGNSAQVAVDSIGRQVQVPYQVRDLQSTGQATLTRAQETTIITGVAASFIDLTQVTMANSSTNAITVLLRYGTAGATVDTITIPATNTIVKTYPCPLPMPEVAQAVTAQVTGTTDQSDSPIVVTAQGVLNE